MTTNSVSFGSGTPVWTPAADSAKLTVMSPVSRALKVGDRVPLFTLPSSIGEPVDLGQYLGRGPVVLAWYLFDFGRV
jgi:hypothetical protein